VNKKEERNENVCQTKSGRRECKEEGVGREQVYGQVNPAVTSWRLLRQINNNTPCVYCITIRPILHPKEINYGASLQEEGKRKRKVDIL